MNSNKDFYRKNKLPEKNSYPDLDRSSYDVKEIFYELAVPLLADFIGVNYSEASFASR